MIVAATQKDDSVSVWGLKGFLFNKIGQLLSYTDNLIKIREGDKVYAYNEQGICVSTRNALKTDEQRQLIKIIFLDIDGVLNDSTTTEKCGNYTGIDKYCLARLKNIVNLTGAKIVLISTWKEHWEKDKNRKHLQDELANYLDMKFAEKGLEIYDKIDDFDGEWITRGKNVMEYIKRENPSNFVIIDDMSFDYAECGLKPFHVKINPLRGLLEVNSMRILGILKIIENSNE